MPPLDRTLPSSPSSEDIDGEPLELKLSTDLARTSPTPDKSASLLFFLDGEPLEPTTPPPANKGMGERSESAEPVQKPLEGARVQV